MKMSIDEYIKQNPKVWDYFQKFAFELINQGATRLGSKMLFERIRYEAKFCKMGDFKVNNDYSPEMARKFEKTFPQYKGIFEMRVCKSTIGDKNNRINTKNLE